MHWLSQSRRARKGLLNACNKAIDPTIDTISSITHLSLCVLRDFAAELCVASVFLY